MIVKYKSKSFYICIIKGNERNVFTLKIIYLHNQQILVSFFTRKISQMDIIFEKLNWKMWKFYFWSN